MSPLLSISHRFSHNIAAVKHPAVPECDFVKNLLSMMNMASSGPWDPAHFGWTTQSNAGIVTRLQLVVCTESDRCQTSSFPLKMENLLKCACEFTAAPQSTSGSLRTTSTYREESLKEDMLIADASKWWYYWQFLLLCVFLCLLKKLQWICITFTVRRSEQSGRVTRIKN